MANASQSERVLWIIMAAVLTWGAFHAVGAFLYNHYWARPAMVLFCVGAFVAWWIWLLRRKSAAEKK